MKEIYKTTEEARKKSRDYYYANREARIKYQLDYIKGVRVQRKHKEERIIEGYVWYYRPEHPKANSIGRVKRAVLVLEEILGRPIKDGYLCHHKDGNKLDDRPENLEEKEWKQHSIDHEKESSFGMLGKPFGYLGGHPKNVTS